MKFVQLKKFVQASRPMYLSLMVMATLALAPVRAMAIGSNDTPSYCYSSYHVQQMTKLQLDLGAEPVQQAIKMDVVLHIRRLRTDDPRPEVYQKVKGAVQTYIFYPVINHSSVDGVKEELNKQYQQPFLVLIDSNSGALIDLKSNTDDPSLRSTQLSFFDLFQYSTHSGEYTYQNGNGVYRAQIIDASENDRRSHPIKQYQLVRENKGFLNDEKNIGHYNAKQSRLSIILEPQNLDCFYHESKKEESFSTILSKEAFVVGHAKISVISDSKLRLPHNHFFFQLSTNLKSWPKFDTQVVLTKQQALKKLSTLMLQLTEHIENEQQFLTLLKNNQSSWPFIADFLLEKTLSNKLSKNLFWALDRIDSKASVNTLVNLTTTPINSRDKLRAIMALSSTKAPLSKVGLDKLSDEIDTLQNQVALGGTKKDNALTFLRMIGLLAKNHSSDLPLQSQQIRELLYSRVDNSNEFLGAAIIDGIGNLAEDIDLQGEQILVDSLSSDSNKIRQSVVRALNKIPYRKNNSEIFIQQFNAETDLAVKNSLIDLVANTKNDDLPVKKFLIQQFTLPNLKGYYNRTLKSLKKIDYSLKKKDVSILEQTLKQEHNPSNQKLLAALILKYRRQKSNY